ncbi:hypothetical protein H0H92_003715 [Tricholoma furcatifolium]|nr:hypothetical protein H0H92_003715 [Tricholoma furcatifolium]
MAFDPASCAAEISRKVRETLRQSLPAPAEQFFTVMVPGTVVNFKVRTYPTLYSTYLTRFLGKDFREGYDDEGRLIDTVLPTSTELNQAILCDDMPVLSPVQLGPTGKSVARSYDAAISKLIPKGTTVGIDVDDARALSDEEARYKRAMDWLTFKDKDQGGTKTRIEVYTERQAKYTKAVESKTKAFEEAQHRAKNDPANATRAAQRAAYDRWLAENAKTYRNLIQAAYMDWVVSGKKEEVEYWFSIVDRDSAMSRVEASKEAMRAAVVQDTDGSVEYSKVKLTPPHWAVLAEKKALGGADQTKTAEWYTWEIARLTKMNTILSTLEVVPDADVDKAKPIKVEDASSEKLKSCMSNYLAARTTEWRRNPEDAAKKTAYETKLGELQDAEKEYDKNHSKNVGDLSKFNYDNMYASLLGKDGMAKNLREENDNKIKEYKSLREKLMGQDASKEQVLADLAEVSGVPAPAKAPAPEGKEPDYFTAITVQVTSSDLKKQSSASRSSHSYGASVGWGWWSASVNAKSNEESAKAFESMSKNDCKISFECMRVNIQRPWLRSELFYDDDLTTAPNQFISPGFSKLRDLMEDTTNSREDELQRYSSFPLYPTACNVVLEFSGETTELQSEFKKASSSGSGGFSYGPFSLFSASGNSSSQSESSSSSCKATSSGCRITVKAPQIIGWVSQMVPALPRLTENTSK